MRPEEWRKMERFEKIRIIREKMEKNKTVTLTIKPAKLPQPVTTDRAEHQPNQPTDEQLASDQAEQPNHDSSNVASDQADQHEQTCQDARQGGDQAEQPGHDASQDHDQAVLDELAGMEDQAEEASWEDRQGDDQAEQSDQGARQDDQPGGQGGIGEQTSSSTPLTIRQPLTIPRAVARCVVVHDKHNNLQLLTSNQLGKAPRDRGQAEQSGDQAEQPGERAEHHHHPGEDSQAPYSPERANEERKVQEGSPEA